jgi:hypothetical protein
LLVPPLVAVGVQVVREEDAVVARLLVAPDPVELVALSGVRVRAAVGRRDHPDVAKLARCGFDRGADVE